METVEKGINGELTIKNKNFQNGTPKNLNGKKILHLP